MYRRRNSKRMHALFRGLARSRALLLQFGLMIDKGFQVPIEAQKFHSAYLTGGGGLVAEIKHQREKKRMRQALQRLRTRRFVEIRKKGNRIWYSLTEKGLNASLRELVRAAPRMTSRRICVISFDIPEQEYLLRRKLVYFLKDCDFIMEHKSVWVSERDVCQLMMKFVRDAHGEKWIRIYDAKRII